jgi:hypothetical protein
MSKAEHIVNTLLETTEKWDNAHRTFKELFGLEKKRHELYKEMGRSIEYHRALAHKGLKKEDVARPLVGANIGATHNYKLGLSAAKCVNQWCGLKDKYQPDTQELCPECHQELVPAQRPISPSDLRGKLAKHIVGVETKDGRTVFFDEPLHPAPWESWNFDDQGKEAQPEQKPLQTDAQKQSMRRLGKWW